MQMGTSPAPETVAKTAIRPDDSYATIAREPNPQILQELEARIAAKMAEREVNWLRGLCLLRRYQQGSDADIL